MNQQEVTANNVVARAEQKVIDAARAVNAEQRDLRRWRRAAAEQESAPEIALIVELCEGHVAAARRGLEVAIIGLASADGLADAGRVVSDLEALVGSGDAMTE